MWGFDALNKGLENFKLIKKLGEGTYGQVNLYLNTETEEVVAIKHVRISRRSEGELPKQFLAEKESFALIGEHRHIIHPLSIIENEFNLGFVFPHYITDLEKLLKQESNPLPREVFLSIFYQMLLSV